MPRNVYQVWKIENFSCWNNEVHGKCIKSPILSFSFCNHLELYPRGISGLDEHLVVRFCDIQKDFTGGELSFFCSDRSTICTLQVKRTNIKNVLDSPLGPKFEDVIARIRKKEADYGDQFTLQFNPSTGKIYEQRMCTNIDTLKILLEIDKNLVESIILDHINHILLLCYEGGDGKIYLRIAHKKEEMQLVLEPLIKHEKPVLIESYIKLLSNNGNLIKYEKNEHVFRCEKSWIFSDSLKLKEVVDEGRTLNIYFKIATGDFKERFNTLLYYSNGVTIGQNTHICVPEEKSSEDLNSLPFKLTGDSLTKSTRDIKLNDPASNLTENPVIALTKDLMCLYQDQDFSDLQLNCGSVSFPVHRAILSARSPVFKRMLSSDMRESESGSVVIEDLDPPTLARFLGFLYTGTVDDLQGESALKLYYAADKYQVSTLKMICAAFLGANVSNSNVCDILSLADEHQDPELLSAARDFVLKNLNEVSRSEEWRCFMKSRPLLAVETMTYLTAKDLVVKKCDPR